MQYRAMLSRISHGKSHHETPLDWYKQATDPQLTRMAKIYEQYEERLLQANALDFDDLLLESVRSAEARRSFARCAITVSSNSS